MKDIIKLMKFINSELQKKKMNIKFCKTSYCSITSFLYFNCGTKIPIGKIEIVYRPDECLKIMFSSGDGISEDISSLDIVEEIREILMEFVADEPICSYNIKDAKNINPAYVIEWDFVSPEQRIVSLAERQAGSHRKIIDNLILYGKRNIHFYTNEAMLTLAKNPESKIHGIYMGTVSSFWKSDNFSEIELYEEIRKWIGTKYLTMSFEDFKNQKEECYGLDFLKYLTKKFGVLFANLSDEDDSLESESFDDWYTYYDNYIKAVLSERDRKKLNKRLSLGEDVRDLIPPWSEYKNNGMQLKRNIS